MLAEALGGRLPGVDLVVGPVGLLGGERSSIIAPSFSATSSATSGGLTAGAPLRWRCTSASKWSNRLGDHLLLRRE